MILVQDAQSSEFLKHSHNLLYADEASNSLMLGLATTYSKIPEAEQPKLFRVIKDGVTLTCALQTGQHNLVITFAKKSELEFLAEHLKNLNFKFPGVVGPSQESEEFADIWAQKNNLKKSLGMGQRIYKLEKVIFPKVLGDLHLACSKDTDLIAQWFSEFSFESLPLPERKSSEEMRSIAMRTIELKQAHLWKVNGDIKCMAHAGRGTENGISVFGVYTPKLNRKNGYASAITAYLSQKCLDSGKIFCVLYTDLGNSTSNKIYQDVGYNEVSDSKHFVFKNSL